MSLREIARRAGVSHGAPRRYFPTHRRPARRHRPGGLPRISAARSAADDRRPSARTRAPDWRLGRPYLEFARDDRGMFELMFRHDLLRGGPARGCARRACRCSPYLVDLVAQVRRPTDAPAPGRGRRALGQPARHRPALGVGQPAAGHRRRDDDDPARRRARRPPRPRHQLNPDPRRTRAPAVRPQQADRRHDLRLGWRPRCKGWSTCPGTAARSSPATTCPSPTRCSSSPDAPTVTSGPRPNTSPGVVREAGSTNGSSHGMGAIPVDRAAVGRPSAPSTPPYRCYVPAAWSPSSGGHPLPGRAALPGAGPE